MKQARFGGRRLHLTETQVRLLNLLEPGWLLIQRRGHGSQGALAALQRRHLVDTKMEAEDTVLVRLSTLGRRVRDDLQRVRGRRLRRETGL